MVKIYKGNQGSGVNTKFNHRLRPRFRVIPEILLRFRTFSLEHFLKFTDFAFTPKSI